MLDVLLPTLTEQVASAGDPKDRSAALGLAKAERGLLTGAISAAVTASLAAIDSALATPEAETEPRASTEEPAADGGESEVPPISCAEGEGTI